MNRNNHKIFDELQHLVTEQRNPDTENIDTASVSDILKKISDQDAKVHTAVKNELSSIENGVNIIVSTFKKGGRLFYIGAGTSGRLGVLDASECPPTFGSDPEQVQGIIAGGNESLILSREGAEDNEDQSIEDLNERDFCKEDVLCGITASKRTPYVIRAINYAQELGAKTIFISCVPKEELTVDPDVAICPVVGPEAIMGSTRLKAGTAQKMVLNMLTTASFIRMGKVYKNMMIDLKMTSRKLHERSKRIVMMVTGVGYETAAEILKKSDGHVKTAIVMLIADVSAEKAQRAIEDADGFIRIALGRLGIDRL
ncbi:N-acetylmuramic acid 6-phosphate etherase [candidate division KSB1 bacterium]